MVITEGSKTITVLLKCASRATHSLWNGPFTLATLADSFKLDPLYNCYKRPFIFLMVEIGREGGERERGGRWL
jgi:hypothetical protein